MIAKSRVKSGEALTGQASMLHTGKYRKFNELPEDDRFLSEKRYRIMYIMGNYVTGDQL
jgi:hypothetical protein